MSANLSSKVPRFASWRLAAADILDASGPPFGCLTLRSCTVITSRSSKVARYGLRNQAGQGLRPQLT